MRCFFPPLPILRLVNTSVPWRNRLRSAIARTGRKQSVIAADAGIAPETLSRILTGTNAQPAFDTVVRITHAAGENVGWLLDECGFALSSDEQRQFRKVVHFLDDVIATVHRHGNPEPNATTVPGAAIPHPYLSRGARIVYEAVGDSMIGAGIADRDLLFVKPTHSTREAAGRIVVCRLGGVELVKVLDVRARRMRLLSRNDRYPPIEVNEEGFELIGTVVGRMGAIG